MMFVSASGKFIDFPDKEVRMSHQGISILLLPTNGVLEIAATLRYLIPRTEFLGTVLMTGNLGGAVFAHLRVGAPWIFPFLIGAIAWLGLALRYPILFQQSIRGLSNPPT